MFSPRPIINPSPDAGAGSTPIALSQDEHELPSLGSPLPGHCGSPRRHHEVEKDHGQQSDAPSSPEPGAPHRSYLAAIQASKQPFAHRKILFPDDADLVPPVSPALPLSQTDLGCYPPKGPDDEIWFMEPGELRKKNLGKLQATPGLYKVVLDGPPRALEMEAAIIDQFVEYKKAQRLRLRDGFFGDKRWQDMLKELHQWGKRWEYLDLDQRKAAIKHGLPDINVRIKAAFNSCQKADLAIGAELVGIQLSLMSPSPPKPLVPDSQEKKTQWAWDTTGNSYSLSNRVLTPVERRLLEEVWSPEDRLDFYKIYGYNAARLYLKYIKSSPDQRRTEVDVPNWFHIFEFIDLNYHLGSLAIKVRDEDPASRLMRTQDNDRSPGLRKEYHKPHPHWATEARRKNGGCPSSTSFTLNEGHATQAKFDLLMECIQAAQRVVAKQDRCVVENRMRVEAQVARQLQASSSSRSYAHYGGAVERVRAELYAEHAARDRLHRRPLGSTADEERNEAAKRLDSRKSRLSAHF
ncbi:hypothetical protein PG994_013126 [Apiospora phragmitis]|uniref:Uncharacterized protein n=1 Tax=Apiospora phragmitis TaxID=2905665 RepID=A0ABR1T7R5_9PEZI